MSTAEKTMPDKIKKENNIDEESQIREEDQNRADDIVTNNEVNSKSTSNKDYQCEHCDYVAQSPTQLSQHQRSHTGDRPYTCDTCGFAFTQKGNLTRHLKTHTSEKPFKCSVCPYEARRRDALLAHMVTHTEDKRHVCQGCGMGYKQKASLREHMKKCRFHIDGENAEVTLSRSRGKHASLLDKEHKKRKSSTPMRNPGVKFSRLDEDNDSLHDLTKNGILHVNDSTSTQGVESAFTNVLAMYGHSIDESSISPVISSMYPHTETNHVTNNNHHENNVIDYSMNNPSAEQSDNISDSLEERSCPSEKENTTTTRRPYSWIQNKYDNEDERRSSSSTKSLCARCQADTASSNNYKCEHCQIVFMDHVMYTIHMGCHGFHNPLECNICGYRSKDKYEFTSHLARGDHHIH
ncbi:uncharacterized protein LOC144450440 isoform X1 [Glandiceps talaboti]